MNLMVDARPAKEHHKTFVLRLCAHIAIGILMIAAVECVAYYWLILSSTRTSRISGPPSVNKGETWAPQYARESSAAEHVQYKPFIVWRHAPFAGKTINVDSEGLRKTSYSSCKEGAPTIWMFGDSALWGEGSPDWETIPSFLAKRYAESGRTLCVKNFGEKGWVSTQETIQLILALKQATTRPDLVVLYDGVSDSLVPFPSNVPDSHTNFEAAKTIFEEGPSLHRAGFSYLRHSNTYHVLGSLQRRILTSASSPGRSGSVPPIAEMASYTLDNYQKNMDLVEVLAQHYGIRCLFVWQPVLLVGNKPRSADEQAMVRTAENELRPGASMLIQATYDRVQGISRPDFLYLGEVFGGNDHTMFVDYHHTSPEGNRAIAERIFNFKEESAAHSSQADGMSAHRK